MRKLLAGVALTAALCTASGMPFGSEADWRDQKVVAQAAVTAQVAQPQWFEYLQCDGKVSPKSIYMSWYTNSSEPRMLKPDGFYIYRKEKGGNYTRIAHIKDHTDFYTDKTVETGKTYYYKVKSYAWKNGKKYVATVAEPIKRSAVYQNGKYRVRCMNEGLETTDELILKITANKKNGISRFLVDSFWEDCEWIGAEDESGTMMKLYAQSTDGKNWKKLKKMGTVRAGETLYLKYRTVNGAQISTVNSDSVISSILEPINLKYNGLYYIGSFDLEKNELSVGILSEYYH